MSATTQTRIFGVKLGIDPKILLIGLIAFAALLFWYNSRGDEEGNAATTAPRIQTNETAESAPHVHARPVRRRRAVETGKLQIRPIDATRGDIDPTLRLDLWSRLQRVELGSPTRSLFEMGTAAAPSVAAMKALHGPKIVPGPLPPVRPIATGPVIPVVNIPFKYYGFAKPSAKGEINRGFFIEGDNIFVASEGDLLQQRFLVVELTPNNARLEDTQLKQGKTIPVEPEARNGS